MPEMPMLHSGMFTKPGYLHVSTDLMVRVPDWKCKLWKDTIAWYAARNGMELALSSPDKEGMYEISWGNKP